MTSVRPGELRGLARSSTLNLIGGGTTALATLLLLLVLTRTLGSSPAGVVLSVVALFQVLIAVAGLGVETGVVRFITARGTETSLGVDHRQFRTLAFGPVLATSLLATAALFWSSAWVGKAIGGTMAVEASAAIRYTAFFLPAAALGAAVLGATRGHLTMRPTVVIERIGRPLLQLGLIVAALAFDASIPVLAGLWSSAYLAQLTAAWAWLRRLEQSTQADGPRKSLRAAAREFWSFTLPRAAATTFRVTLQWFDVVLVAALASPGEAAIYTVATRMLQLGLLTAFAVGQAVEPMFGQAVASGDASRTRDLYKTATAWLILMTWPFYLMLAFFASSALELFGTGFDEGAAVVVILVVSVLFGAGAGPVDILLVMTGKSSWSLWNTAASLAANIGLNLWLIPVMGIEGAALAWTVSRILANSLPLYQLARARGLHPFGREWTLATTVSLVTFGLAAGAARTAFGSDLGVAALAGVAATALFALLVNRFRRPLALDLAFSALRKVSQ